jgi:hypothetical protein
MRKKKASESTLSSVTREMAKPRIAESARKERDTVANGGHISQRNAVQATPREYALASHLNGTRE